MQSQRRTRGRTGLAAVLAMVSALAEAGTACPQPLRIGFSDSATPPGVMGQGPAFEDPPGWEVAAVREALQRLGCPGELLRQPSRRLGVALAQGELEFAMIFAATPERLRQFRFPLDARGRPDVAWAPAFGALALYGLAGSRPPPGWDGHRPPGPRVGVVAGTVQEKLARERGWPVEPVASAGREVPMLKSGRFGLLLTWREDLSTEDAAELSEWQPLVARLPFYMPASQAVADRHPAWTRRFWNEVCRAVRRQAPQARPVDCGTAPPGIQPGAQG